jgi:phosphate transport system substrate-binding protein
MAMRFKAIIVAVAVTAGAAQAWADPIALKESGSTLIEPLFRVWATDYAKKSPDVSLTTAGTGSGQGMAEAFAGAAQIGASDAYMSDDQAREHPEFVDVALAISAMTINYNLPELSAPLKLDGPTLAGIYMGSIRSWDDKAIAALNPGVSLPHHDIIPVHRADGSGDTFIFSQYLSFATTTREDDVSTVIPMPNGSWGDSVGYGTTINWPKIEGALEATGNDGMVETLGKTPYAIGYVGLSFTDKVVQAKLGAAAMRSYSGQFLQPNAQTITAAAASLTPRTPADERLTLVNAPGADCYPLINYEYAVVSKRQTDPKTAAAIRDFLQWAITPDENNAKRLGDAHMIALPAPIWAKSHEQIEAIR